MNDRSCECGRAVSGAAVKCSKCSKCVKRELAQAEIDESIRRQFNPEHTPMMFADAEEKK